MKKHNLLIILVILLLLGSVAPVAAKPEKQILGINVLLNTEITDEIVSKLGKFGRVNDQMHAIKAVSMRIKAEDLTDIQALPFVISATPDAERTGIPMDTIAATDFADGLSTWNLDAINVTDFGFDNRQVDYDGTGVYVAVLDTGLVTSWRSYFPEERIAEEYAISFGGGGMDMGEVSEQPNKWEHDVNSHGTHVTSTILGYDLGGTPVNGVAPLVTVIPVKVLNQNGSGWSSVVAQGIQYVGELKAGPLADYPVVINMSLGGSALDPVEQAAIDFAIAQGVIIVASAGNEGESGMGYPGAYAPVISVGAAGWVYEWYGSNSWWWNLDVPDPTNPSQFYITDFSSRALAGQDLDVVAPGSWIVGPYQLNSGQLSYYFLGGTSMASPHVAGLVALMAEKNPLLTAAQAETILEDTALELLFYPDPEDAGSGMVDAVEALSATP